MFSVFSIVQPSRRLASLFLALGLTAVLVSVPGSALHGQIIEASEVAGGDSKPSGQDADEVRRLVEALGADSYATRLRARDKLQRMGLEAIDALRKASNDLDSEIALSAKAIVSSYSIVWYADGDPEPVRNLLEGYGAEPVAAREARILMLSEFPERSGLPALVRIARFESATKLSRRAAIEIMEQVLDKEPAKRKANAALIHQGIGLADRQATEWLQVYADDLAGGQYSADKWRSLVRKQRDVVDSLSSEEVTRESVLGLVRICAERAVSMGNQEEGLRLAIENIDLIPAATTDLIEATNWATANQLPDAVLTLYKKNRPMFERSSVLLYGYAFVLKSKGDEDEATRIADSAYQLSSFINGKEDATKMQPREAEEVAKLRREIATSLRDRGMFEWAEREYRGVIDSMPLADEDSILCRIDLSTMYGELERHQDVVDVVEALIERTEKDDELKAKINGDQRMAARFRGLTARADYHRALIELAKVSEREDGQDEALESVRKQMMSAFLANPADIDVLIKMYRMDGDDDWRAAVKAQVTSAKQISLQRVKSLEDAIQRGGASPEIESIFAETLNNYSWLVCNTEGDYKQALKYSLRSLEISEDSAKLDTCARCYFAVGDLASAIRMQKRAIKIDPYSPPLKRQLREFEEAKKQADAAGEEAKDN